jgi:hypothetical protein
MGGDSAPTDTTVDRSNGYDANSVRSSRREGCPFPVISAAATAAVGLYRAPSCQPGGPVAKCQRGHGGDACSPA